MKKRNILNSPRLLELKSDRRKLLINKILLSVVAFAAVFATCAYMSRLPRLKIMEIEVTGNKVTDSEAITQVVQKDLAGNYLKFFPKTNILIYPENNIIKDLRSNFKRLQNIHLSVVHQTLEISVTERAAAYMWCGHTFPETDTSPKCYFMDSTGFIFDEAPYFSGEVYFKFYGSIGDTSTSAGSYFFKDDFSKLVSFKKTLEGIGLTPVALNKEDTGDVRVFLSKGKTQSMGPEIIFKSSDDAEIVAENLQAALSTEPLQSNFKNKYSSLEYIDLRYGNKVYYKFK